MSRASETCEINKRYNIHVIWVLEGEEKKDWDKTILNEVWLRT